MSEAVIKCESVYKIFGENAEKMLQEANGNVDAKTFQENGCIVGVNNASFEVTKGEMLVVMGLSGSGKSTMAKFLSSQTPLSFYDLDLEIEKNEGKNALIMIDECHSTGFMGEKGRGVHELKNVMGKIDIITGTLGKALGGASGGFTSGRKEVIEVLRQRSRPYLFSNTLAPSIVGASLKVFDLLERNTSLIKKLHENTSYFRKKMKSLGFDIVDGTHPIVQDTHPMFDLGISYGMYSHQHPVPREYQQPMPQHRSSTQVANPQVLLHQLNRPSPAYIR